MEHFRRYFLLFLISLCSFSCSHVPARESLTPVEDLHIYEDVTFEGSPFDEPVQKTFSEKTHFVSILNVGDEALLARIHLFRAAQKAIYIQTFIWTDDEVGRWTIEELVKAAERGVKVKLMIDYLTLDKNLNNKMDADESVVGDFKLLKDMGANSIRVYHHDGNKNKDLYKQVNRMFR